MTAPSLPTIKRLYAECGNKCTFPNCNEPMVDEDGNVLGEICHIAAQNPGGPRFGDAASCEDRHGYSNLILLCRKHHKVIDNNASSYTAETLREMKGVHCDIFRRPEKELDRLHAGLLINQFNNILITENSGNIAINSPGTVQAQSVNIKPQSKSVSIAAPPGSIGTDRERSGYVSYLIKRYNEFASKEPSRQKKYSFGALSKTIESKFGTSWKLLSISRFDELCIYIQNRISRTRIAKKNIKYGRRTFSTFDQHKHK